MMQASDTDTDTGEDHPRGTVWDSDGRYHRHKDGAPPVHSHGGSPAHTHGTTGRGGDVAVADAPELTHPPDLRWLGDGRHAHTHRVRGVHEHSGLRPHAHGTVGRPDTDGLGPDEVVHPVDEVEARPLAELQADAIREGKLTLAEYVDAAWRAMQANVDAAKVAHGFGPSEGPRKGPWILDRVSANAVAMVQAEPTALCGECGFWWACDSDGILVPHVEGEWDDSKPMATDRECRGSGTEASTFADEPSPARAAALGEAVARAVREGVAVGLCRACDTWHPVDEAERMPQHWVGEGTDDGADRCNGSGTRPLATVAPPETHPADGEHADMLRVPPELLVALAATLDKPEGEMKGDTAAWRPNPDPMMRKAALVDALVRGDAQCSCPPAVDADHARPAGSTEQKRDDRERAVRAEALDTALRLTGSRDYDVRDLVVLAHYLVTGESMPYDEDVIRGVRAAATSPDSARWTP